MNNTQTIPALALCFAASVAVATPTVLFDFETATERASVPKISNWTMSVGVTNEFASSGSHAAFFHCPHWETGMPEWPAFDMKPLGITDWRGYDRLVIDLVNIGGAGNTLYVYYSGNIGSAVKLPANGYTQWIVPLSSWPTPTSSANVEKLHFFSYIPSGFTVMIDRITLLREGDEPSGVGNAALLQRLAELQVEGPDELSEEYAEQAHQTDAQQFALACRAAGQTSPDMFIGSLSSTEVAMPRGRFTAKPVTNNGLGVRLARNEYESVQMVVVPASGDLDGVRIAVDGDLTAMQNAQGTMYNESRVFAASNIVCDVVGYVHTTNLPPYMVGHSVPTNNAAGYVRLTDRPPLGWWPNPILGFLNGVNIRERDAQSFWIRVHCPEEQKAGVYRGTLVVSAAGVEPVRVPFSVRVNGFALPRTSMLQTAVTFFAETHGPDDATGAAIRNDPSSPYNAWKKHTPEWVSFFADYLISYDNIYQKSCLTRTNELLQLKGEGRLGMFNIGKWDPPWSGESMESWTGRTLPTLVSGYEWARANGVLDHAYIYGCDEVDSDRFAEMEQCVAALKNAMPEVPLLTTARDSEFGVGTQLSGIDWFCPLLETYRVGKADAARAEGHQVWWYICNYPFAPYPNMYIECQPIEGRLLMGAQSLKMKLDGFLYYQTGIWESPNCIESGPFTDWNPRSWRSYHGDGSWTCVGPDGIPVPTIRLENFRDGLEDYAYAKILERMLSEQMDNEQWTMTNEGGESSSSPGASWVQRARAALAVPREVVDNMTNYTDDSAELYGWRDEMADLIEAALCFSTNAVFAGYGGSATNRVDEGTAIQAGPIVHAGTGTIYKLGEGTWRIPENAVRSPTLSLGVLEGSVSLAEPSADVVDIEMPTAILDKAALWLDAGVAATRTEVSSNGCVFVDRWCDVRDSGASSPTHLYAVANHALTNCSPEYMVKDGRDAVWFGGLWSKRTMNWMRPNGSRFTDRSIRHVFCVHGIDKTWGFLFGTISGYPYFHLNNYEKSDELIGLLWSWSGLFDIVNARSSVNGLAVNPQTFQMKRGFQLLDVDMGRDAAWIETFFNDRNLCAYGDTGPSRAGGDYICECIAFTEPLTDAERVKIQTYLMQKWGIRPEPQPRVLMVAEGAAVEAECAGERSLGDEYVFRGSGELRKTGAGALNLNSHANDLPDTSVRVEDGTAVLTKTFPLALSAGDRVTANSGTNGPRVTVAGDAPAGTIVKDGNDSIVLRSIPLGLERLTVTSGEVVLTPSSTGGGIDAANAIEVSVPNGGFEDWDGKATGVCQIPAGGTVSGWTAPGKGGDRAFFYRRASGVCSVNNSMDCMAWPVEGDSYFVLRCDSEVYTTVELPDAGTYELSFWAATRYMTRRSGHPVDIYLDDPSRGVSLKVGRSIAVQDDPFFHQTHRVTVDRGGPWRLRFKGRGGTGNSVWGATMLDDIRLRRVPEQPEDCWRIPGGGFESVTYAASGDAMTRSAANVQDGWPLSGSVYYVTRALETGSGNSLQRGLYYNDSRFPAGGFTELYFDHDNYGRPDPTATTTFRPPAGTWQLAAEMAGYRLSDFHEWPWATIAVDGEVVNLGTNRTVEAGTLKTYLFPNTFTVDGNQTVTLVLGMYSADKSWNEKSGLIVDDLRLVPGGTELVENGGFESGSSGWMKINTGTSGQSSVNEKVSNTISANWTLESCEGTNYFVLAYSNILAQAVHFPAAGHYRLSWRSHCRYDARTSGFRDQMNPDLAWIEKDGVRLVIGRGLNNASWWTQHTFDFDVPEGGEWTFGLQGTNGGSGDYYYMTQHLIDDISIKRIGESSAVSTMLPEDLRISIADGARMQLGFSGVNRIGWLKLDGWSVTGTISAQTHPDFFYGTGALLVVPRETLIKIR